MTWSRVVARQSGLACGAVAIFDRNVVFCCGAVRILCTKWAGVVARWPFSIVSWSPVVARCGANFVHKVGWRCGTVAIFDRNVVSCCGAVRIQPIVVHD